MGRAMSLKDTSKLLGFWGLVMLISGAIDSIRNLPTTALFGTNILFFFIVAAVLFLIPVALISAELSAHWPKTQGIYGWMREAFSDDWAFLAIWLQWINTVVWYPTLLSFIAGTLAYLINPHLAQNKWYLMSVILVIFWTMTLANMRGLKTSAHIAEVTATLGLVLPMCIIIICGITWYWQGHPMQISLHVNNIIPNVHQKQNWIALTAIITSFLGMELATVHIREVRNPQSTFPQAIITAVIFILTTMILGSLSIAAVLPAKQIHLVDGTVEAFQRFFQAYGIGWGLDLMVVLILIGACGSIVNWLISPARGLALAAQHGYIPQKLAKENHRGVAYRILLLQAVVVTGLCAVFLFMPTVNDSYWLLTDLSTELYCMMYILMFIAAIRLAKSTAKAPGAFKLPGGHWGTWFVAGLGAIGALLSVIVGFFPPTSIWKGNALVYTGIFATGIVIALLPAAVLIKIRRD
jgi:glutamate:GABA antiporter